VQKRGRPLHLIRKELLHNLMMNVGKPVSIGNYYDYCEEHSTDVIASTCESSSGSYASRLRAIQQLQSIS
jgi:hypothetical protein